uniref:Uncharacterized protein n=1 Tax=Talaromyces marneffei PM1 TaxID=1077442 RepID=A0A093UQH0_TALMA
MPPKRLKRGAPWPTPRFAEDPDIRAYAAAAIKDLTALKKHEDEHQIDMLYKLAITVVEAFLYLIYI